MSEKDIQSTAVERIGYKIAPYRMAQIAKTAAKITAMLTDTSPIIMTAQEAEITLDMVQMLLDRGKTDCS